MFKTLKTVKIILFCDFITRLKSVYRTAHVLLRFCHLINRSFGCKAKEGHHIRIFNNALWISKIIFNNALWISKIKFQNDIP